MLISTNSFVSGAFARTGNGASTTVEFGPRLSNTGFGGSACTLFLL